MKYIFHETDKILVNKLDEKLKNKNNMIVTQGRISKLFNYLDTKSTVFVVLGTSTCDELPPEIREKFPELYGDITLDIEIYGNINKDGLSYFDVGSVTLYNYENGNVIFSPIWYTKQDITDTNNLYWVLCGVQTVLDKCEVEYKTVVISGLSDITLKDSEIADQIIDSVNINTYLDIFHDNTTIAYTYQARHDQPKIKDNERFFGRRSRKRKLYNSDEYEKKKKEKIK